MSSFTQFEAQVLRLLKETCSLQNITLLERAELDLDSRLLLAVIPDGFRDLAGPVLVSVMASPYLFSMKEIWEWGRKWPGGSGSILFIIQNITPSELKTVRNELMISLSHKPEVHVWGPQNLEQLRSELPTQQPMDRVASTPHYTEEIAKQIRTLHNAWKTQQLALFLGAGCSARAQVPKWNDLLASLAGKWIEKKTSLPPDRRGDLVKELMKLAGSSLPVMARYLRIGLEDAFLEDVRQTLYARVGDNPDIDLLRAIASLCSGSNGIKKVVTYNYDNLFELALTETGINHCVSDRPTSRRAEEKVEVIHVHGYIPREGRISTDIVLDEESYNRQANSPFSWASLVQLSLLTTRTCLFVGHSMTDPNLRRLLGLALENQPGLVFYAAFDNKWKRLLQSEGPDFVERLRSLEESHLASLGVKPVFVDDYSDLPALICSIATGP